MLDKPPSLCYNTSTERGKTPKRKGDLIMKVQKTIAVGDFNVHQFDAREYLTLCDAENLVLAIANKYPEGTILASPNTGEVIMVDELRRVAGILSFLTDNRVVEVNP
jgi:hypothetical protein